MGEEYSGIMNEAEMSKSKRRKWIEMVNDTGIFPQDQGRCVLDGYLECAAKVSDACICVKMPEDLYKERWKAKYGVCLVEPTDPPQ